MQHSPTSAVSQRALSQQQAEAVVGDFERSLPALRDNLLPKLVSGTLAQALGVFELFGYFRGWSAAPWILGVVGVALILLGTGLQIVSLRRRASLSLHVRGLHFLEGATTSTVIPWDSIVHLQHDSTLVPLNRGRSEPVLQLGLHLRDGSVFHLDTYSFPSLTLSIVQREVERRLQSSSSSSASPQKG